MKKATGIGGIFFKCQDPNKIKEWHKIHLGLNTDQYGATFEWSPTQLKKVLRNGARLLRKR